MRRALVSSFILLYLALHASAAVRGVEDYPLTAAVMFARDIGPDRPVYTLHWWVTDREGKRSDVEPRALGLHPRAFFLDVYLPALPDSPYHGRRRPADSPASHEARMSGWFGAFTKRWAEANGDEPERVDLVLRPHAQTPGEEVLLGTFTPADGRYRLAPREDSEAP